MLRLLISWQFFAIPVISIMFPSLLFRVSGGGVVANRTRPPSHPDIFGRDFCPSSTVIADAALEKYRFHAGIDHAHNYAVRPIPRKAIE